MSTAIEVCKGFFKTAWFISAIVPSMHNLPPTIVTDINGFLGETCKVDDVLAVRVDIEQFYAGPEVVHELA